MFLRNCVPFAVRINSFAVYSVIIIIAKSFKNVSKKIDFLRIHKILLLFDRRSCKLNDKIVKGKKWETMIRRHILKSVKGI